MSIHVQSHARAYSKMCGYLTPEEVSTLRGRRNGIPDHEIYHAAHCMVSERVTSYSPYRDDILDLVYALLKRETALRAENADLRHDLGAMKALYESSQTDCRAFVLDRDALYEQKLQLESELKGDREHIRQLRVVAKHAKAALKAVGYKFHQEIGNLEAALRAAGEV